jgi:hypothetical protein
MRSLMECSEMDGSVYVVISRLGLSSEAMKNLCHRDDMAEALAAVALAVANRHQLNGGDKNG